MTAPLFLPQHGHFRRLRVYQVAELLYDLTYHFAHKYLQRGDRTIDQMVQAARSGKQNIAEGNMAGAASQETDIKLTNVARASLGELLLDYEDYLRVRQLPQWTVAHPRYAAMRTYAQHQITTERCQALMPRLSDEELANLCITLLHQADVLLQRLLEHQQRRFLTEGGIRETMTAARLAYRKNKG